MTLDMKLLNSSTLICLYPIISSNWSMTMGNVLPRKPDAASFQTAAHVTSSHPEKVDFWPLLVLVLIDFELLILWSYPGNTFWMGAWRSQRKPTWIWEYQGFWSCEASQMWVIYSVWIMKTSVQCKGAVETPQMKACHHDLQHSWFLKGSLDASGL